MDIMLQHNVTPYLVKMQALRKLLNNFNSKSSHFLLENWFSLIKKIAFS
jgi:hypothetical protein